MLSFFPLDALDEIWDLIESVSEGFFTYSYLFLYLYITRITVNNTPHLKSPKNQKKKSRLGTASNGITGGLNQFAVDQPSLLILLWFTKEN